MKVKLYTTSTCPFCKMEKEYLDIKGVKYENVLVDEDQTASQEMIEISGQMGVPFTVIWDNDGKKSTVLGFDKPALDKALGI